MNGLFLTVCLSAIIGFAVLAKMLRLPYPIVFVIGGIVLALIPGVPEIRLAPDTVFLLFLPPLIFGDGWSTDFRAFKRYLMPIASLSIGLVTATSVAVAWFVHAVMGLPLAVGFVLGAILSPTDAVATDAIAEELGMPRRLATVISGESLVNDATGLVIFRFAVVAVATGAFSFVGALGRFVYVAVGGIAIGLLIAWLLGALMIALRKKGLLDPVISVSISLVTPFALYAPADALGTSGVLAAMSGAVYLSWRNAELFEPGGRLQAGAIWELLFFIFNGAAFVLIGLQLRSITRALTSIGYPPLTLVGLSLAVAAVVIVVRYAWVFLVTNTRNALNRQTGAEDNGPLPFTWQIITGTAGMRGVVSLAAALAIPETIASGAPFPNRDLLLFITFVVILVTLVGQGLLLPVLIRKLGVISKDDGSVMALARLRLAEAACETLREREDEAHSPEEREMIDRFASGFEQRIAHARAAGDPAAQSPAAIVRERLLRDVGAAQRSALARLRSSGEITDEVYWELQRDIDLLDSRGAF
jgi:CPA1 family monovalent cation:H+ antiporter